VLARYAEIAQPPQSPSGKKRLWELAGSLVPADRPGDFNQALMELGALVCSPRNPTCLLCPLSNDCLARRKGLVDSLPAKPRPKPRKQLRLATALILRGGRVLVARRHESGLFGGLWELPSFPDASGDTRRLAQGLKQDLGLRIRPGRLVASVDRVLTHRELTFRIFACAAKGGRLRPRGTYVEARFVKREELAGLGMSSAMGAAVTAALG
jgi:A/G-specific adenine glycosylase